VRYGLAAPPPFLVCAIRIAKAPSNGSDGRLAIILDAGKAEECKSGNHYLHRYASR
jgi:hypothetical protein